jgi:excisionase family DNA binding protein
VTTAKTNGAVDAQILVDLAEAARRLSLSPRSIQNLIFGGELPSLLIGRARRIEVSALAAYVARLRQEQQT